MQKKEEDVSAMTPLNSCFITSENTGTSCKNRNTCLLTQRGYHREAVKSRQRLPICLNCMEKKTGIKITPHMLRRYYANTRWEADWPLEMISQALGHKHLDTTIRYLNVLDDKLKTASQEFYRRYSKLYGVEQFLESRR